MNKTIAMLLLLMACSTTLVKAQEGFGTSTPAASAVIDMTATDKGFLPPRMTSAQIANIANPVEGLTMYDTTQKCLVVYNGTTFIKFTATAGGIPQCNESFTYDHKASDGVAPVDKTVTYSTESSNKSGSTKCWILQDLGATSVPTDQNDISSASTGWYWRFNRAKGYIGSATWTDAISENSNWIRENDPCYLLLGGSWRIPTNSEITNVKASMTALSTTPWGIIRAHQIGWLDASGGINDRGGIQYIWTSTQSTDIEARVLIAIPEGFSTTISKSKSFGANIKCLRD
ncbi:MAG: hypothetical protein JZU53_01490 [Paludibacter sp.]|nr:hypothetical protein [Paludibacter sp.]